MSLLFAGGMASGVAVSAALPQSVAANQFINGVINHFKSDKFPSQNINIFRASNGTRIDCYPSPAATSPAIRFTAGSTAGAIYQNFYVGAIERFVEDAKKAVNGKGKLIIGGRAERTGTLSSGPLISFGVGPTYYGIPATNETDAYCEAVVDFTNNVLQGYVNGVMVYSTSFDSSLPTSCFIGSNYVTIAGAGSPAASIGPSGALLLRDCYVALDGDEDTDKFGVQGSIRIAYPVDLTGNGGKWSEIPLSEAKTKVMTTGGTGGSLVVSDKDAGTLTFSKPVMQVSGTWTPVGATVESWSSRTDPSNVSALEIVVSTVEGREAIRGKTTTAASLSLGYGVTKQITAKDYSFDTGIKLAITATKP